MSEERLRISWTFMQQFEMTTTKQARRLFSVEPAAEQRLPRTAWIEACRLQELVESAPVERFIDLSKEHAHVLDEAMCLIEDDEAEHTRRIDNIEIA